MLPSVVPARAVNVRSPGVYSTSPDIVPSSTTRSTATGLPASSHVPAPTTRIGTPSSTMSRNSSVLVGATVLLTLTAIPDGHDLTGVGTTLGIKHGSHGALRGQRFVGEDAIHVLDLIEPDAMLARNRSAGVNAHLHDLPHGGLHALHFVGIRPVVRNIRVQIPVAGVKDVAHQHLVSRGNRADPSQHA